MGGYRLYDGFIVPRRDTDQMVIRRKEQARIAMEYLPHWVPEDKRRVCVEAGGNWGLWPLLLSDIFDTVYTFEPDHACFTGLVNNCRHKENVVAFQAALGSEPELVNLSREEDTTGNQYVIGKGIYPTFRVDDLGLDVCDLIYLDIEGCELDALIGAQRTIGLCKPIVIFEVTKKLDPYNKVEGYMSRHGYYRWGSIGRDLVMGPFPFTGEAETTYYNWNEDRTALVETPR